VGTYSFGVLQSSVAASRLSARIIAPSAAAPPAAPATHMRVARELPCSAAQGTGLITRSGPAPRPDCSAWQRQPRARPLARWSPGYSLAAELPGPPTQLAVPSFALAPWSRQLDPALVHDGVATAGNDTQQAAVPRRPVCMPRRASQHASRSPRNACPEPGDHYFHATKTLCGIAGRQNPRHLLAKAS
jgi:hypothetical protein